MKAALAPLGLCAAVGTLVLAPAIAQRPRAEEVRLTSAQSDYLEQCAGCHGLQGDTAPAPIPILRGRVGYFMCNEAGREYLLRLPNIVHSGIDDESLADMMNFVVFELGPHTAPAGARKFTAQEVGRYRSRPMFGAEVQDLRKGVIEKVIKDCAAPASLRLTYPGQLPATPR